MNTEDIDEALEKLFDNPLCVAICEPINVTLVRVVPKPWRPGPAGYYLEVGNRQTSRPPDGRILDHHEALDMIRGLVNFYSETTPEQIRTENRHQWEPGVTVRVFREMEKRNDPEVTASTVYLIRAPSGEIES